MRHRRNNEILVSAYFVVSSQRKPRSLTRAYVIRELTKAWEDVLWTTFGLSEADARLNVRAALGSGGHGDDSNRLLTATLRLLIGRDGVKALHAAAKDIKTEEQLAEQLTRLGEGAEQFPTQIRKAMKELAAFLPRRGGPGRQPKLDAALARKACDQIATLIRHGDSVKGALHKVSAASPTLLGKRVGARTLQKHWLQRGKSVS